MNKSLWISVLAVLSVACPAKVYAEDADNRLLWYGVGVGSVAVLCDLYEHQLISKETLDQQLASLQEPAPNVDVGVIMEAVEEMRNGGEFKNCL